MSLFGSTGLIFWALGLLVSVCERVIKWNFHLKKHEIFRLGGTFSSDSFAVSAKLQVNFICPTDKFLYCSDILADRCWRLRQSISGHRSHVRYGTQRNNARIIEMNFFSFFKNWVHGHHLQHLEICKKNWDLWTFFLSLSLFRTNENVAIKVMDKSRVKFHVYFFFVDTQKMTFTTKWYAQKTPPNYSHLLLCVVGRKIFIICKVDVVCHRTPLQQVFVPNLIWNEDLWNRHIQF